MACRPPRSSRMRRTSPRCLPATPMERSFSSRISRCTLAFHTFIVLSRAPLKSTLPSSDHVSVVTSPRWPSMFACSWHVMPLSSRRLARNLGTNEAQSHSLMDESRPALASIVVASWKRTDSTVDLWPLIVSSSRNFSSAAHTFTYVSREPVMRLVPPTAQHAHSMSLSWRPSLPSHAMRSCVLPALQSQMKSPSPPPDNSTLLSVGWKSNTFTVDRCPSSILRTRKRPSTTEVR